MNFLLEGLNEAQKKVALHKEGPLLVAGRIFRARPRASATELPILSGKAFQPEKILAITFTNKGS